MWESNEDARGEEKRKKKGRLADGDHLAARIIQVQNPKVRLTVPGGTRMRKGKEKAKRAEFEDDDERELIGSEGHLFSGATECFTRGTRYDES